MSGNIGNLGATNRLKDKNDTLKARHKCTEKWMKHARGLQRGRGLLKVLALGLMLACGTAYAAEPTSPASPPVSAPITAPTPMAKNKAKPIRNDVVSPDIGDSIFDWSIAFFFIILVMFFSIQFLDSKKKDKK